MYSNPIDLKKKKGGGRKKEKKGGKIRAGLNPRGYLNVCGAEIYHVSRADFLSLSGRALMKMKQELRA